MALIGLDIMGGDFAPQKALEGAAQWLRSHPETASALCFFGTKEALDAAKEIFPNQVKLIEAPQIIGYNEHPVKALKEKQQSSIAMGFGALASGKIDAFISAGNTGAMLVGSMFSLKMVSGIQRPTIATIIPRPQGKTGWLLDVGINSDCKPELLNQFASIGAAYASSILGIQNPKVGLLNIGEEEGKGNQLAQQAYPLLKANSHINFCGNMEGRDILTDGADVIVCDGFTGNIILKLLESLYPITKSQGVEHEYFDRFHFEQYGGTPVLGVEKPVIIGHGVSGELAFAKMIELADKMIAENFLPSLATWVD